MSRGGADIAVLKRAQRQVVGGRGSPPPCERGETRGYCCAALPLLRSGFANIVPTAAHVLSVTCTTQAGGRVHSWRKPFTGGVRGLSG